MACLADLKLSNNKKIKVVHIQVLPKMSGVQQFSYRLLSNLPDNKYEKYILFSSTESVSAFQKISLIDNFSSKNIKIIWLDSLKRDIGMHDFRCLLDLYRIFKKYQFDIVHTNSTKPGIVARFAARLARVKKIIHTVHGIAFHNQQNFFKRLVFFIIESFFVPMSHYNVCVNKYYLKFYNKIPFSHALTIYNGMDFSLYSSEKSDAASLPLSLINKNDNSLHLLFVGRLDFQKDPLTLLAGFKLLLEKIVDIQCYLHIVGDGELFEQCKTYCVGSNIEDRVIFHGWVAQPQIFYSLCDVFVCSSVYEAFGFTLIEAGFYGLPIVATKVEGIPEVVVDGKTGILVPPSNPEKLSLAIENLICNPSLRESFGNNGKHYVINNFSIFKMVAEYESLYLG